MVDDFKSRLSSASASPSRPPGGGDQRLRTDVTFTRVWARGRGDRSCLPLSLK